MKGLKAFYSKTRGVTAYPYAYVCTSQHNFKGDEILHGSTYTVYALILHRVKLSQILAFSNFTI